MKKPNSQTLKRAVPGILFIIISVAAYAQKLPNIQTISLRAPADIKIDGRAMEWNDQFQAYNHATEIFYTISNDNQHLYLTVQAAKPDIISKIIAGGITFTVQKSGKKIDKDAMGITFPVFEKNNKPALGISIDITGIRNGVASVETSSPAMTDSVIAVRNEQLSTKSKYIATAGIPGIDTLLSIYNENGIKAGQFVNAKGAYTYELAVDLKLLGLSVGNASAFAYHIILNGMNSRGPAMNINPQGQDGSPPSGTGFQLNSYSGGIMSPTDFWGEYTLAKK